MKISIRDGENYLSYQDYQTIVTEYIIKNHGYNTGITVSELLDQMIKERKNGEEVIQLPARPRGRHSESNH